MVLTLEPPPEAEMMTCADGHLRQVARGYVRQDGDAYAVYFASGYPERRKAWIDVILGTWGEGRTDDHVTFGCRVGPIEGQAGPSCSLVDAAAVFRPEALFGDKLDRPRALAHPRLAEFWAVVDLVLQTDPAVRQAVYGTPAQEI